MQKLVKTNFYKTGSQAAYELFWYGCASQYFKTYPIHIPGLRKNGPIHILDHPKCWPIHILPFDFLYPFFAGYYTNIIVNSCNTKRIGSLEKSLNEKYVHIPGCQKNRAFHIGIQKNGAIHILFVEKRGPIIYLTALKKGAIWHAHPYYAIYRKLPPPPEVKTFFVKLVPGVHLFRPNLWGLSYFLRGNQFINFLTAWLTSLISTPKGHALAVWYTGYNSVNMVLWVTFLNPYNSTGKFSRWQIIFFLFFPKNSLWPFVQIVSPGDNLHERSKPIYLEK